MDQRYAVIHPGPDESVACPAGELFDRHGAELFAFAFAVSGEVASAEMAVQQAFCAYFAPVTDAGIEDIGARGDLLRLTYRACTLDGVVARHDAEARALLALTTRGEHTYCEVATILGLSPDRAAAALRDALLEARRSLGCACVSKARGAEAVQGTTMQEAIALTGVVTLIKDDHTNLEALFKKLESAEPTEFPSLLRQVADLLIPHSRAEEQVVYPAIKRLVPAEESDVDDGLAEHQHVEDTLERLLASNPQAPGTDRLIAAMIGEIRHLVEEEEQDILPAFADAATNQQLSELGERFTEVKEQVAAEMAR